MYNSVAFSTVTMLYYHLLYLVPKYFIVPKQNLIPVNLPLPISPSNSLQSPISILSPNLSIWDIIQYVTFCVRLLSLSLFLSFTHIVACTSTLFIYGWVILCCIYYILFSQSTSDGHTAISICVQIFVGVLAFKSFWINSRSEIGGSYGNFM